MDAKRPRETSLPRASGHEVSRSTRRLVKLPQDDDRIHVEAHGCRSLPLGAEHFDLECMGGVRIEPAGAEDHPARRLVARHIQVNRLPLDTIQPDLRLATIRSAGRNQNHTRASEGARRVGALRVGVANGAAIGRVRPAAGVVNRIRTIVVQSDGEWRPGRPVAQAPWMSVARTRNRYAFQTARLSAVDRFWPPKLIVLTIV